MKKAIGSCSNSSTRSGSPIASRSGCSARRSRTDDRAFIERLDLFFLATVNSRGEPSCSYKGGDPGFVRVLDPTTLVFPCYDGNGMYLSMGNVAANHQVGMLFIDLCSPKRLRVNGTARIEAAGVRRHRASPKRSSSSS